MWKMQLTLADVPTRKRENWLILWKATKLSACVYSQYSSISIVTDICHAPNTLTSKHRLEELSKFE